MKDGVKHEKIRYLLFGYQIIQRKIVENPPEKELVEEIYQKYLQGCSIKQLTLYVEQSGIPYRENSNGWNKNMIARILEDERYWNGKQYPPIISKELADSAVQLKRSKATPYSGVMFIQKKMICPICGKRLTRNSQRKPIIFWNCQECQRYFGPISDDELRQMVMEKLLEICR
jgi:ribosomal protein L37AE/L43A